MRILGLVIAEGEVDLVGRHEDGQQSEGGRGRGLIRGRTMRTNKARVIDDEFMKPRSKLMIT